MAAEAHCCSLWFRRESQAGFQDELTGLIGRHNFYFTSFMLVCCRLPESTALPRR